jgi:hypothetical protein
LIILSPFFALTPPMVISLAMSEPRICELARHCAFLCLR